MKSSSRAGPRNPALSELWLSATGWPKFVVSPRPPESTRTRSRGSFPGLNPGRAWVPVLSEETVSVNVLPVVSRSGGSAVTPRWGFRAAFPYSLGLFLLVGKAAARVSVFFALRAAGSLLRPSWPPAGPLTVALAADLFLLDAFGIASRVPGVFVALAI